MRAAIPTLVILLPLASWSPLSAAERLTGDAITGKIVGNTITIVTKDLRLATGLVQSEGSIRGHIGGEKFEGSWFIKNGMELCFDLPETSFDICRVVIEDGRHIKLFTTTGEPGGRAEILKGNPYNL